MGIIAKFYNASLVSGLVYKASSIRKGLDDIYNAMNESITSENFLGGDIIVGACQVGIIDADEVFSGTTAEEWALEVKPKGYNSIHVFAYVCAVRFYPGIMEVNSVPARINTEFEIATSLVAFITGSITANGNYALTVPAVKTVTASDIMAINIADTSTVTFNVSTNGYYFSSSRRVLFVLRSNPSGDGFVDNEFLDTPDIGHEVYMSGDNTWATNLGFNVCGTTVVCAVMRLFDYNTNRYGFRVQGITPINSTTLDVIYAPSSTYSATENVWHVGELNIENHNSQNYTVDSTTYKQGTDSIGLFRNTGVGWTYQILFAIGNDNFKTRPYEVAFRRNPFALETMPKDFS